MRLFTRINLRIMTSPPAKRLKTSLNPVQEQMSLPIEHVKTYQNEIDYRNKLVLAPMVRSGTCKSRRDIADNSTNGMHAYSDRG
jgi:hypothetical protein